MRTEYPHLQEVLDKIKQANKDIKDEKEYDKLMEKLNVKRFK